MQSTSKQRTHPASGQLMQLAPQQHTQLTTEKLLNYLQRAAFNGDQCTPLKGEQHAALKSARTTGSCLNSTSVAVALKYAHEAKRSSKAVHMIHVSTSHKTTHQQPTQSAPQQLTQGAPQQPTQSASQRPTQGVPQQLTQGASHQSTQGASQQPTQGASQAAALSHMQQHCHTGSSTVIQAAVLSYRQQYCHTSSSTVTQAAALSYRQQHCHTGSSTVIQAGHTECFSAARAECFSTAHAGCFSADHTECFSAARAECFSTAHAGCFSAARAECFSATVYKLQVQHHNSWSSSPQCRLGALQPMQVSRRRNR